MIAAFRGGIADHELHDTGPLRMSCMIKRVTVMVAARFAYCRFTRISPEAWMDTNKSALVR
ncbi:MAG: hypothetical protein KY453_08925, partial [Gemmatimonadetes bacterium]|nr:hypothetical protein [Gemmatimonadota bacterium]